MRNLVYVAPFPMATTLRFARALAGLERVRLLGVFQRPPAGSARGMFETIVTVRNALDVDELLRAVGSLGARYGTIHRVVGILEDLQEPLGAVREHLGIPGETRTTAERFRDKGRMKDALRRAGLPCAAHARITDPHAAVRFAERHGFPFVMKPAAGSGCRATFRVGSPAALQQALAATRPSPARPVLVEAFLRGQEFSFETITVGGKARFYSINHYHPTPLEVMENDWLQWVVTCPWSRTGMDDAIAMGLQAVEQLGMDDGMTHMEWFRLPDGKLAIGEIAMRPPGAQFVRLMSVAHGADMYRAWARAVVDSAFDGPYEQRFSVGMVYLRGPGQGRVLGITGVRQTREAIGKYVVEARLPTIGAPRSTSYEGDGWVLLRHPTDDGLKEAIRVVLGTLRVHYAR